MRKYFLDKEELALIAPYVDSDSLLIPEVTPKRNGVKPKLKWATPSKEDVSTIINFIDMNREELAPLVGCSSVTIYLHQNQRSDYDMSYSTYVILCKLAAKKLANKKMPKLGDNIFTPAKQAVLENYVNKESLVYSTQPWEYVPKFEQVAAMIDKILSCNYVTKDIMQIFGLQDRITRAKKKDSPLEFSQFVLLCEAILKVEKGQPL